MASRPTMTITTQRTAQRPGAPSTVSTSSSTSSNATIRPHVTTPRATSPASRMFVTTGSNQRTKVPGSRQPPSKTILIRHPHWAESSTVQQNTPLLDVKDVLKGLSWRLEQFLDMGASFPLIEPEMVVAARQDMSICGTALDLLASAVLADGDPPICELPLVKMDANGKPYAENTVPVTSSNSPDALKPFFAAWQNVAQRVQQLDPPRQSTIARIICDLDLTESVMHPLVNQLATDLRKLAKEINQSRSFLDQLDEAMMNALKESARVSMMPIRKGTMNIMQLPTVGEGSEPTSSQNSSRSSSRSSRRGSRSHSRSSSRRGDKGYSDMNGERGQSLKPKSSTQSLRLGADNMPLLDGEYGDNDGTATGSEMNPHHHPALTASSPRPLRAQPGSYPERPSSRNQSTDIYSGVAPITIPAFTPGQADLSNLLASTHLEDMHKASRGTTLPGPPPNNPIGVVHLQPMPSDTPPVRQRGPRPLPPRPSPSPQPPQQPLVNMFEVPSMSAVPDQNAPAPAPFTIPPPPPTLVNMAPVSSQVFFVPSISEVSSSSAYDLQKVRDQYAMGSNSSLAHSDHESVRSRRVGRIMYPSAEPSQGPLRSDGFVNNGSSNPLIPNWGSDPNYPTWYPGPTGNPVPQVVSSEPEPKKEGFFDSVKTFLRGNQEKSSQSSDRNSSDSRLHPSSVAITPQDASAYYRGRSNSPLPHMPPANMVHSYGPIPPHPHPLSNGHSPSPRPASPQISPGYANAFQANPVAASSYHGAGPSGSRRSEYAPTLLDNAPKAEANRPREDVKNPDVDAIVETVYAAIAECLGSSVLRPVLAKDEKRAYYSAMGLAILNVSPTLQQGSGDTPNLIRVMSRNVRLTDLPGAYRTCATELASIGREVRKLREEDDERAIAYVARGKSLPEPRISRVQKLLERGVGWVGADGRVRGTSNRSGGTGRSLEFSNKITTLALDMMKLPAFQEEKLRKLVGPAGASAAY
ncbi:SubName: Full=Uncharacterized protein {ECO:0000313/EMBL:CCA66658.1} [Serendipita indica DSM 11827]|nr:SubName: Full=Uncharacterized protein {ECO:0000313/EMBL:CCA66658.1} [Serendipita indica DSM 11827]